MASPTADRPSALGPPGRSGAVAADRTNVSGAAARTGVVPADWPAQAADTIVETVDKVRDKTTRPAQVAARAVVYGLLGAVVGTIAVVLLLIGLIRALDNWVPGEIWTKYAGIAVVFTVAGIWALRRANQPAADGA
jgi:hypothetical protein